MRDAGETYQASQIKRRATKAEVEERRAALLDIVRCHEADDGAASLLSGHRRRRRREVRGRLQQGADRPGADAQGGQPPVRLARR